MGIKNMRFFAKTGLAVIATAIVVGLTGCGAYAANPFVPEATVYPRVGDTANLNLAKDQAGNPVCDTAIGTAATLNLKGTIDVSNVNVKTNRFDDGTVTIEFAPKNTKAISGIVNGTTPFAIPDSARAKGDTNILRLNAADFGGKIDTIVLCGVA